MNTTLILNFPFVLGNRFTLKLRIIWRVFLGLGILSIIALVIFYIFQVNAEISERYSVQKYVGTLNEISEENKNLEINSLQLDSLENISGLLENLNFVKSDKIHYIRVLDNQVVSK